MKLIFAGTPPFAAAALAALCDAGHDVALVLTQPDRPAGRGQKIKPSAVAETATARGLRLAKPATLKEHETQALLQSVGADVLVVAAYGLLLPPAVLSIPTRGCINIHGSILPRWRGAAPVQRAIEAGDTETGITIMQMDAGLDTGNTLLTKTLPIAADETSASLFAKLTVLGAGAIVEALCGLDSLIATPQPAVGATYARKIDKAQARIQWQQAAAEIERRLRAFDPSPGCEATLAGHTLKIWRASLVDGDLTQMPGTVLRVTDAQFVVQCGTDALNLDIVQRAGGTRQTGSAFLRGTSIETGARFND